MNHPTESPSPSPLRKSLEELAREAAQSLLRSLVIRTVYAQQTLRPSTVEEVMPSILTALRLAVAQQEEDARMLLEHLKAVTDQKCDWLAHEMDHHNKDHHNKDHSKWWKSVLKARAAIASAMRKEAQG